MIDPNSISTISDLRFKTKEVLNRAVKKPIFLFNRSKPTGVLLSLDKYEAILETLEDYQDTIDALILEKEDKSKVKWMSHEEVKKLLNV